MIKEGCENLSALLIILIFYLKNSQKPNLSLDNKNLKWGKKNVSLSIFHSYCVKIRSCMGKTIFTSLLIMQYNCTLIGSCRIKKTNQCTAVAREPMAMQPAIPRQNRRGVCYIISCFLTASQISSLQRRRPLPR